MHTVHTHAHGPQTHTPSSLRRSHRSLPQSMWRLCPDTHTHTAHSTVHNNKRFYTQLNTHLLLCIDLVAVCLKVCGKWVGVADRLQQRAELNRACVWCIICMFQCLICGQHAHSECDPAIQEQACINSEDGRNVLIQRNALINSSPAQVYSNKRRTDGG